MNIIIVGAGMIGKERIKALEILGENIVGIYDPNVTIPKYKNLTEDHFNEADWVFVCVPHLDAESWVWTILSNSLCNVLVEKPLGIDLEGYKDTLTNHTTQKINVGLNYRFYKGVNQLLQDVQNKLFGDLISVNMILSLGDAPGTEKTWRLNPLRAGRGAILDPGIHLIDLAMPISEGTLKLIDSRSWSGFWETGIEEETHLLATDKNNTIYNIQASVCHWRNTFRIEVNGTEGYGIVEGRNRHYGNQTYRRGKRWGWQSGQSQRESEELIVDYDGEDSFLEETKAVLYGCKGIQPATHEDNKRCLEFINTIPVKQQAIYYIPFDFTSNMT